MSDSDATGRRIGVSLELSEQLLEAIARRAAELVVAKLVLQQGPESGSPYLTIREAAAYARCKRQRIDDLLSMRRLSRYKDGSRTLILRAELDAYLAQNATPAANITPAASSGTDWISPQRRASVGQVGNRGRGRR